MTSKIREPYDNESDECARLIYISGPNIYSYSFVAGEPKIYEFLKLFYKAPGTMFSKGNIIIEEENGEIRGLLLAYPASDMMKMAIRMLKSIKQMIKIGGLSNFLRMLFRLRLNKYLPRIKRDEFYISNLAVFEEYRGKGIATKLLDRAEEMAAGKGLRKLSLYVETDNHHAKKVYEKRGFQEVKKAVLPESYNKYGLYGSYKMVKELDEN